MFYRIATFDVNQNFEGGKKIKIINMTMVEQIQFNSMSMTAKKKIPVNFVLKSWSLVV